MKHQALLTIQAKLKLAIKVPLTPNFFRLIISNGFPVYFSEKIILIDKMPAFLQAFEHAISMFTTAQTGSSY